jgi:hypothetical protein
MKYAIVIGLIVLVLYMANAAPAPVSATSVPNDNSVAPTGVGPVQSPAMWGGRPLGSVANQIRLDAALMNASQTEPAARPGVPAGSLTTTLAGSPAGGTSAAMGRKWQPRKL